jgi:hypothetical protein
MPQRTKRYPPSTESDTELRNDLTLIEERLQGILVLMRGRYGERSRAALRAEEATAALQRLIWELEPSDQAMRAKA